MVQHDRKTFKPSTVYSRRMFCAVAAALLTSTKFSSGNSVKTIAPLVFVNVPYIQSFAIDEKTCELFVQSTDPSTDGDVTISRYLLGSGQSPSALDSTTSNVDFGHQGLTIQYEGNQRWLWTGGAGRSLSAVRFQYATDGTPREHQTFKLFDESFRAATITTAISHDQRWLVASVRANKKNEKGYRIRVFDLKTLNTGPGDFSKSFTYEWQLPVPPKVPIQGIASINDAVFVSIGTKSSASRLPLFQYSVKGDAIDDDAIVEVAKSLADSLGPQTTYEPEGLCFAALQGGSKPSLLIALNIGPKRRVRGIFHAERG